MRKFPYFICVVAVALGVAVTISSARAEEVKAPNVIFRPVGDVLDPETIKAMKISMENYIAVYMTDPSSPITMDDKKYYIIVPDNASIFKDGNAEKAKRGEIIPYYLSNEYLSRNKAAKVPVAKPASAPAAPAVTAYKPAAPAEPVNVPTPLGKIVPKIGKDGKPVKNQFVINYLVPDPANPGKFISMTSEVITKDTDVRLPDGTTQPWISGIKYFLDQNTNELYPARVEMSITKEKDGQKFKTTEVTTYMPDGEGGVTPRAAASEDTLVIDDGATPTVTAPKTTPVAKPAKEGRDYQAPTPNADASNEENAFSKWWDKLKRKPAEAPKEAPKDPIKSPASVLVRDAKDTAESMPGVSATPAPKGAALELEDLDSWDPVTPPMVFSAAEILEGFDPLTLKSVLTTGADGKPEYKVTVSLCPASGPKACFEGIGIAPTEMEAKSKAAADARTRVSKFKADTKFIIPGKK